MFETRNLVTRDKSIGDTAVDGLLAGVAAGFLAAVVLVLAGLAVGDNPATVLGRFDASGTNSAAVGGLMHLAVSAIYGSVFSIGCQWIGRIRPGLWRYGWFLGLVYGLALMVVAELVFLPATDSPLLETPLLHFGLFHAAYGLALSLLLGRYN